MAWYVHCHIQQRLLRSSSWIFFWEAALCFNYFPSLRFPPSLSFKHSAAVCQPFFFFPTHKQSDFFSLQFDDESLKSTSCQFGLLKHQIALKKKEVFKSLVQFLGFPAPFNYFIKWNAAQSLTVCVRVSVVIFFVVIGNWRISSEEPGRYFQCRWETLLFMLHKTVLQVVNEGHDISLSSIGCNCI